MLVNYFTIMSGADKEMMHSAMLKFLLGYDDFFRRELFPECPSPIAGRGPDGGEPRILLEAPYPGRRRIDVEAHSADGKYVLIIENKFKAFPSARQLGEYDGLFVLEAKEKGGRTAGKTRVTFLVCFDAGCAPRDPHGAGIRTGKNAFWHIRTYKEIRDCAAAYLESGDAAPPRDIRIFLEHYVAYLDDYYAAYDAVREKYSLAFAADDAPLPAGMPAKLADGRFWKRLVLSAVGNAFARGGAEEGLERFGPEYNNGNTSEPFLDIVATGDTNWHAAGAPCLFVQMQGRELKLFTRGLDPVKTSGPAGKAFLNHCLAVQKNIAAEKKNTGVMNKDAAMRGRIEGKAASFKIYTEKFDTDVPVAKLVGQLRDFVLRMDAAVRKTGPFSPPQA